ncbi:MAG: zeta toxin family protein [Planctomycetota bacterium]
MSSATTCASSLERSPSSPAGNTKTVLRWPESPTTKRTATFSSRASPLGDSRAVGFEVVSQKPEPKVVLIAGPNGAGKSTLAPALLRDTLRVSDFVNADVIAQGLSAFGAADVGIAAGRIMLERLHELAERRVDFAFESTLESRSFAPWLEGIVEAGYRFDLVFVWLPTAEMAIARVQARTRVGGHHVPPDVIRRRWERGLRNFFTLYAPLAQTWRFYDNSSVKRRLLASGGQARRERVHDANAWSDIKARYAAEG